MFTSTKANRSKLMQKYFYTLSTHQYLHSSRAYIFHPRIKTL